MPVYVPPPDELLRAAAQTAADRLALERPADATPEIAAGLAAFLAVVARILADNLNREAAEVDSVA